MTNKRKDGKCPICVMDNCRCKDLAEAKNKLEGWEKRFDERFRGENNDLWGNYSDDDFGANDIKAFISNLLSLQRREDAEKTLKRITEMYTTPEIIRTDSHMRPTLILNWIKKELSDIARQIEGNKENK